MILDVLSLLRRRPILAKEWTVLLANSVLLWTVSAIILAPETISPAAVITVATATPTTAAIRDTTITTAAKDIPVPFRRKSAPKSAAISTTETNTHIAKEECVIRPIPVRESTATTAILAPRTVVSTASAITPRFARGPMTIAAVRFVQTATFLTTGTTAEVLTPAAMEKNIAPPAKTSNTWIIIVRALVVVLR